QPRPSAAALPLVDVPSWPYGHWHRLGSLRTCGCGPRAAAVGAHLLSGRGLTLDVAVRRGSVPVVRLPALTGLPTRYREPARPPGGGDRLGSWWSTLVGSNTRSMMRARSDVDGCALPGRRMSGVKSSDGTPIWYSDSGGGGPIVVLLPRLFHDLDL